MRGGMIESKSAFIKRTGQEPGGEYDGSETALKSLVFGGTRSPDQVARELYGQGLLSEDSVGELWSKLDQERQTVTKAKEDFKNAKKLIRDAKATAKQEAQDWLDKHLLGHGVTIQPVVVFSSPEATLSVSQATLSVLYADKRKPSLKATIRSMPKGPTLSSEQIAALEQTISIPHS